jgi:hypothetical protein
MLTACAVEAEDCMTNCIVLLTYMDTKYDKIVEFLLNNWFVAVFVLICVILIAIPQIRDGLKMLYDMLRIIFKRIRNNDVYVYEREGEKATMVRILKSKKFDVIKIDTTSHDLGIQSEYAWLKTYYPKFKHPIQYLSSIQTEQGEKMFDMFPISNGKISKEIYFDISSFFEEPLACLMEENEYITHKIKELYRLKE